jgi:hypothetical protein
VVTAADGTKTPLAPGQEPTRDGVRPITKDIAEGKNVDEIAREHGWTRKQVIAQLAATGFEVRTREPSGKNGHEKGAEVVDRTGKVFAGHYWNQKDGSQRTYFIDAKDNEVSRTRHRDGTVKETATDPEGRKTEKTTENGTTTVEVTFNGYTLTTAPDGGMTLTDNSNGDELKIKPGSAQAALARTLLAVNPNSSDPAKAKEGEVVKTVIDGIFAGERLPELVEAARESAKDAQRLIDKYDSGPPAAATLDGPFGEAQAKINKSQAQFDAYALDPAYKGATDGARATINKALAPQGLQWNPEKPKGTLADAKDRLNAANSLFDKASGARGEYETAARVLDTAIPKLNQLMPLADPDRQVAYQTGSPPPNLQREHAQGLAAHAEVKALVTQVGLHMTKGDKLSVDYLVGPGASTAPKGTLPDGAQPVAITVAGRKIKVAPDVAAQYEKNGIAALTRGGKAVAIEIEVTKKDGSKVREWRWLDPRQAMLKIQADSQLELAEAYHASYSASSRAVALDAQKEDFKQKLLAEYNREHPSLLKPGKEHQRVKGDHLGVLEKQELQIRGGQLWVVNHFEEGTTEQQLTFGPKDKNVRDEYRNRTLNKEWQKLYTEADPSQCTTGLLPGAKAAQTQAGRHLNDVVAQQQRAAVADLDKELDRLRADYAAAVDKYGVGSADAPKGTLPDGVQPVEIAVGGQTIKVAPDVAEQYRTLGVDALTRSDKAVWIEIPKEDGSSSKEGRWVDPHLAVRRLQLDATELQRKASDNLRKQAEGLRDWYDVRLSKPQLLADENPSLDKAYLDADEHDEQKALDGIYQSKFQSLLAAGYDNQFRSLSGTTLDETVTRTLGFDAGTEEGHEALKTVADEIREIGGDTPQVRVVPIFHVDETAGAQQTALIAVKDGEGKTWYVDATGQKFENIGDFQDNNRQFQESGNLVVPTGLEMKAGADGRIALDAVQARNVSAVDKVVDPIIGIGTTVATVASFTPAAPIAAPLATLGGLYLGGRAAYNQWKYLDHGGEWGDKESLMNVGMVATTALPLAAAGLRTGGLAARTELSLGQAAKGSIGAIRTKDATLGIGNARLHLPKTSYADDVSGYLESGGMLNTTARGMDAAAMGGGTLLIGESAHQLAANGDQMSGLQLADAITSLGTGLAGTGLGARGLLASRGLKTDAARGETRSPNQRPQYSEAESPQRGGTIELAIEGEMRTVRVLGPRPQNDNPARVYVPPKGGPRPTADALRTQGYTHQLVMPEGGEPGIVPILGGGSKHHVPGNEGARRGFLQRLLGGARGKPPRIDEVAFHEAMKRSAELLKTPGGKVLMGRFEAAKEQGYRFGVSTEQGDPRTGSRSTIDSENKVIAIDRRYASDPVKFLRSLGTQLSRAPDLPYGPGGRPPSELVRGITNGEHPRYHQPSEKVLLRGVTRGDGFRHGFVPLGTFQGSSLTPGKAHELSQTGQGNLEAVPATEVPWVARQFAGGTASGDNSGYVYVFKDPVHGPNPDPNAETVSYRINDLASAHRKVRLPFEREHMLSQIPPEYIVGRRRVENGRFVGEFEYNPNVVWRIDRGERYVGGERYVRVNEVRGPLPESPDAVFVPQKPGHTDKFARDESGPRFTHELIQVQDPETTRKYFIIQPIGREASE